MTPIEQVPGRKIDVPDYCCKSDIQTRHVDDDCDHDYPPESKKEHDTFVEWTCSRCGGVVSLGVYQ